MDFIKRQRLLLGSLLWLGAMALILWAYPRYRPAGQPLLQTDFESGFSAAAMRQGSLSLVADAAHNTYLRLGGGDRAQVGWDLAVQGGAFHLHLRCRLRTQDLIPGAREYERALVTVYVRDAQGKNIATLPNFGFLDGSHDWHWLDQVIILSEHAHTLQVRIRNLGTGGTMEVDDFSLEPVADHLDFRLLQGALLLGVFALVAAWLRRMNPPHDLWAVLLGVLFLTVVFSSICSRAQIVALSRHIGSVLALDHKAANPPAAPAPAAKPVDPEALYVKPVPLTKLGHFLLYALLALFLVVWTAPDLRRMGPCTALFAFLATATEIFQIAEIGRTPHLKDIVIDVLGAATGAALGWVVRLLVARFQRSGSGLSASVDGST